MARKIVVSGNDIYIAGDEWDNPQQQRAVYWRNSARNQLNSNQNSAVASSIAVSNGTVYVSGVEEDSTGKHHAVLWTNGYYQRISDGVNEAEAYALSVNNGNVYLAGASKNGSVAKACYWLNGTYNAIAMNNAGAVRSILAAGDDLYMVGYQYGLFDTEIAILWKNNGRTFLSDDTLGERGRAWDVFVR
jgi:hypothetical protein